MSNSISQRFTPVSLLKFAFPSMVMMVFMSMYSIVDGIFVSRFVGSSALSAINIVYPIISLLYAVGIMLATGGSAIVGKELGEGNNETARKHFTLIILTGLVVSVVFLVVVLLFATPLSYLMGSNENLIGYCRTYLMVVLAFAPASILQMMFQSFFVTAGKPGLGLAVTVAAGITNAILDYVFMSALHMGIEGAALATGIGQTIPAVIGIVLFIQKKGALHFEKCSLDLKVLLQACSNGISEMVTNISSAIVTYLFNIILMRLAGETGVAAITIILYGQFLFCALFMGFSMGVAPVLSFHFGAKNWTELKNVAKISRTFICIVSVLITVLSYLVSELVTAVFVQRGSDTYYMTVAGFMIFSISYLFSGLNIFTSSYFTALSDGKTSAILSFARTFVCLVACLLILPKLFGINGVWMAVPVAEGIAMCLSIFFTIKNKIA